MQKGKIILFCSLCFWILCIFQGCAPTKPLVHSRPYYRSPMTSGTVAIFKIWVQDAQRIFLVGGFNNWKATTAYRLVKGPNDIWEISTRLSPGCYEYAFLVDGRKKIDLVNDESVGDGRGGRNSVLVVH